MLPRIPSVPLHHLHPLARCSPSGPSQGSHPCLSRRCSSPWTSSPIASTLPYYFNSSSGYYFDWSRRYSGRYSCCTWSSRRYSPPWSSRMVLLLFRFNPPSSLNPPLSLLPTSPSVFTPSSVFASPPPHVDGLISLLAWPVHNSPLSLVFIWFQRHIWARCGYI